MSTLYAGLTILLVVVSISLIALVLLQKGKGADAGAAFGSGASGTVFGARGSTNFLSRTTAILATVFFVNCLALAYLSAQREAPASLLESRETTNSGGASMIPAEVDESDSTLPGQIEIPTEGAPDVSEALDAVENTLETESAEPVDEGSN